MTAMTEGLDEFLGIEDALPITKATLTDAFESIAFTYEVDSVEGCNLHRFIVREGREEIVYTGYMTEEVLWYSAYLFMLEVNEDREKVARMAMQTGQEYGFMVIFANYINRVNKLLLMEGASEDTESHIK